MTAPSLAPSRPTPAAPRARVARRAVHGVLLLDKSVGLSSNDALQRAKRLFRAEKAGHTGTLDPLATGLLPICFGAATKFAHASLEADKAYRGVLKLGITTSTGDAEGEVLERRPVAVTSEDVRRAGDALVGSIEQRPPMHSALKHGGRPLYAYAREGRDVEREARTIVVHALEWVGGEGDTWTFDVRCSKGTYVRTLAEAIGAALGCGAHLAGLRRTASGELDVRHAHALEALEALDEAARDRVLLPVDALLSGRPVLRLGEADAARFLTGLRRRVAMPDAAVVRVYGPQPGALLGSARVQGGEVIPTRLLSPIEVAALAASPPSVEPTATAALPS
jgi:tRNA pseudouridine55 synthase